MDSIDEFSACDSTTSIAEIRGWVDRFAAARQWERFHRPKNLAMSVAIEAGELMEHFQWEDLDPEEISPEAKQQIGEELSDVLSYLLRLASVIDLDVANALQRKMVKNSIKYPETGS